MERYLRVVTHSMLWLHQSHCVQLFKALLFCHLSQVLQYDFNMNFVFIRQILH